MVEQDLGQTSKRELQMDSVLICRTELTYDESWLPGVSQVKNLTCRFDPWVGKTPWRRKRHPTPVFLLEKIPGTQKPGGLQSMGLQRLNTVEHTHTHTYTHTQTHTPDEK